MIRETEYPGEKGYKVKEEDREEGGHATRRIIVTRGVVFPSFRDLSPWVFLRVRPWIDSLCRTEKRRRAHYVEDARGPLAFNYNDHPTCE